MVGPGRGPTKTEGGTARLDQILEMSQEEFYDEVGYPVGWR